MERRNSERCYVLAIILWSLPLTSFFFEPNKYLEAVKFCGSHPGYHLCTHHAVCPLGPGNAPVGGYKGAADAWVPISDSPNEWVMVSSSNTACKRYSQIVNGAPPTWGEVGGNKAGTEHVLCCKGSVKDSAEEEFIYGVAAKKFHPTWYHREEGYNGRTWQEASDFCAGKSLALCEYDAYCPMSDLDVPIGGTKELGSYAPVADGKGAFWISVSNDKPCAPYGLINGSPPPAILSEESSRHVACCIAKSATANQATVPKTSQPTSVIVTSSPTSKPTRKPTREPSTSEPSTRPIAVATSPGTAEQTFQELFRVSTLE